MPVKMYLCETGIHKQIQRPPEQLIAHDDGGEEVP